jgi:hypothetical protein
MVLQRSSKISLICLAHVDVLFCLIIEDRVLVGL